MFKKESLWMGISGALGLIFFLVANFTHFFLGLNLAAGIIQVLVNIFVFIVWSRAFVRASGFKKFVAFWGVLIPAVLAGVTIWNVLIPRIVY